MGKISVSEAVWQGSHALIFQLLKRPLEADNQREEEKSTEVAIIGGLLSLLQPTSTQIAGTKQIISHVLQFFFSCCNSVVTRFFFRF